MERVWPGPLHKLTPGPACSGPERLQTEVRGSRTGLAAGSVPASAGPRGGGRGRRPMAAAASTTCPLQSLDPAGQHLLPRSEPQSRLVGAPGVECGVGYIPTLPWQINRKCPSDSRCDSPFIQLTARTVNFLEEPNCSQTSWLLLHNTCPRVDRKLGRKACLLPIPVVEEGVRAIFSIQPPGFHTPAHPHIPQHPLPTPLGCKLRHCFESQGGA